ncbi:MAG TPA: cupin domain-containing protein [Thioalkalivibrio sp.]|nr:cupin domain-containing protein [Thioalkalivibrio sp.]
MQLLGGLSAEAFLRDYWQQRPLLVRQAIPGFASPLSPDELAGLSCEEGVSARIIREHGETGPWQVSYGPFAESVFATLPETHWTLLVSDVEKHVPELLNVIEPFRFLPDWRIDDLMISYAPEGGSVGPHIDDYDVFLLQAHGHRRWQVGGAPLHEERYLPDLELRILEHFDAAEDWVMAPGDMLYLPPRYAHHGVATDDCLTYSIGFRAPAQRELVTGFAEFLASRLPGRARYGDAGMAPVTRKGEIDTQALDRIGAMLAPVLQVDRNALIVWFGQYATELKNPELAALLYDDAPDDAATLRAQLAKGRPLERAAVSRTAFVPAAERIYFFWDGQCRILPDEARATVETLCEGYRYAGRVSQALAHDDALFALAHALFQSGCLGFEDDDGDAA